MHRIDIPLGHPLHISGDTGVGKTTLLDGWLYALVGDEKKLRFNAMAGPANSRHVSTYIRRHKDGQAQRTNTGKAHVLLEWTNIENGNVFVCGVVWDYNPTAVKPGFLLADSALSLELVGYAVEGGGYCMYDLKELRRHLELTQPSGSWNLLSSASEYRQRLAQKFGNLPERWFDILARALGNIDTSNLTRLVRDLVIGREEIDVSPLRTYVQEVQQAQIRCAQAEQQLSELEVVIEARNKYQARQHEHTVFEACLASAKLEQAQIALTMAKERHALDSQNLAEFEEDAQRCNIAYQQACEAHERAQETAQSSSDLLNELKRLRREQTRVNMQLEDSRRVIAQVRRFHETYQGIIATLAVEFEQAPPVDWQAFIAEHCLPWEAKSTLDVSIMSAQNALQRWLASVRTVLQQRRDVCNTELRTLKQTITERRPILPEQTKAEHVKTQLENQGAAQGITMLADLVTPDPELDDTAQGMLEALLGARRWTLIPAEADFERCQRFYRSLPHHETENIHLVRPADIEKHARIQSGSMAELVHTENHLARGLLNLHLNQWRWEPDEDAAVAERANRVVSRGLQISGGTLYRRAPLAPHKCVFGQRARAAQQQECQARLELLHKQSEELDRIDQVIQRFQTDLDALARNFRAICESSILEEAASINLDLQAVQAALSARPQGDLFIDSNPLQALIHARDAATRAQTLAQNKLDQARQQLQQQALAIANQELDFETQRAELARYTVAWREQYQTLRQSESSLAELIKRLSNSVIMDSSAVMAARNELTAKVMAHIQQHHIALSHEPLETQLEACLYAYTIFKEQNLPQLKSKLAESKKRADAALVRHFVDRVSTDTTAHGRTIKNVNRAIQDVPLGSRRYRFAAPQFREDNPRLVQQLHDLLITYREAVSNYGALEAMILEYLRRDHGEFLDQLAEFLAKEENALSAEELRVRQILLEPASYYDFQVEYQSVEDGAQWHNLNRHIAAGSGGEQQLPNYIVLIAAMAEVYRDGTECPRILAFDEGFNKAPIVGIEGVSLMLDLGLQPLIITPTGNTSLGEVMGGTVYVLRAPDGTRYIKARFHEDYELQYARRMELR